jgi:hypothetical protein
MKGFLLACLLGSFAGATVPLLVTSVERTGLPPFEGTERIYRLEGTGCQTLRVGEVLVLKRPGERRNLGGLKILSVHSDHALARLSQPGDTFPLKGDQAVRTELFLALPEVPVAAQAPLAKLESLRPHTLTRTLPPPVGQGPIHREAIFFIKGDASLSPGAQVKLRAWVAAWGVEGQWSLECPPAPGELAALRASALRSELQGLGVPALEIKPLPEEPTGRYDAVYVTQGP